MGGRVMGFVGLLIVAFGLLQGANAATRYTVGDAAGWSLPPNNSLDFYENWAANKTFQIGDSLVFNWTGTHTATELANEEEYDNCTKMGLVFQTSGLIVSLDTNGTRYFVCSVGTHCEQGMKVEIKVGNGIPPAPSAAPALTCGSFAAAVFSSLVLFFFNYM